MKRFFSARVLAMGMIFLLLSVGLTGCRKETEKTQILKAPENDRIAVGGTWTVDKVSGGHGGKEGLPEELLALEGKTAQFGDHFIQVGNYALKEPHYKIKVVDGQKFSLYGKKMVDNDYSIDYGNIQVVTVYDQNRSFCEIVLIDKDRAVLFIEDMDIYLKKTSDKITGLSPDAMVLNDGNNGLFFGSRQDGTRKSGVLLGLRTDMNIEDGSRIHEYRTLWISAEEKKLKTVKECSDLFYPRRNGFWKLWVQSNELYTRAVNGETPMKLQRGFQTEAVSEKWIDFLCNDYISIQSKAKGENTFVKRRVVPIEMLPSTLGISASELLGNSGIEAIHEGLAKAMLQHGVVSGSVLHEDENFWNFGVIRKTGHWFLEGRFYYGAGSGNFTADYAINLIPPPSLVYYDEAKVAWTEIKDNVPEAVDAFSSPNGDIALIFTKKNLVVYGVTDGKLDRLPLNKIPLRDGEQPIMAEWATGRYTNFWEDAFDKACATR